MSAHSASPHRHGYNFSQFSFVRTLENSHDNDFKYIWQICLLGDVGEKVHATRKYGWKVQSGHWNSL